MTGQLTGYLIRTALAAMATRGSFGVELPRPKGDSKVGLLSLVDARLRINLGPDQTTKGLTARHDHALVTAAAAVEA
ncbi:MAG TPA: hypothetical protein VGA71_16015 [Actinomycetota bacterium]